MSATFNRNRNLPTTMMRFHMEFIHLAHTENTHECHVIVGPVYFSETKHFIYLLNTMTSWKFDFSWNSTSSTWRDMACPGHNSLISLNQPSRILSIPSLFLTLHSVEVSVFPVLLRLRKPAHIRTRCSSYRKMTHVQHTFHTDIPWKLNWKLIWAVVLFIVQFETLCMLSLTLILDTAWCNQLEIKLTNNRTFSVWSSTTGVAPVI